MHIGFFTEGTEVAKQHADGTSPPQLPVLGTSVGIRTRYGPPTSGRTLTVSFAACPGLFDEAIVETVDAGGQASELMDFSDAGSAGHGQPTLQYHWTPSAQVSQPLTVVLQEPDEAGLAADLVHVKYLRPGTTGTAAICVILAVGLVVLLFGSERTRWRSGRVAAIAGAVVVSSAAAGWLCPDVKMTVNRESSAAVLRGLLSGVYCSTVPSGQVSTVSRLSRYLADDLVESVYLSLTEATMSSESGELFVSFESLSIEAVTCEVPESATYVETDVTWRVRGTVHHWGHAHARELVSVGRIGLARDDHEERWKIQAVSLTEAATITAPAPTDDDS